MRNTQERVKNIFEKAAEKKHRRAVYRRTAAAVTVSLVCVLSSVAVAVGNNAGSIPLFTSSDFVSPNDSRSTSLTRVYQSSTSESGVVDTVTGPLFDIDSRTVPSRPVDAPSAAENPDRPTEPRVPPSTVPPTEAPPTAGGKVPPRTVLAPSTTPAPTTGAPHVQTTANSRPTQAPSSQTQTSPTTEPVQEPSSPVGVLWDDKTIDILLAEISAEWALLHEPPEEPAGDSGDSAGLLGVMGSPSDYFPSETVNLYISQSLSELAKETDEDRIVKARIYVFCEDDEAVRDFMEENTISYLSSGDSYLTFMSPARVNDVLLDALPGGSYVVLTVI